MFFHQLCHLNCKISIHNTAFCCLGLHSLLAQIISSPFYEEIRTRRQLGYIVYATPYEMLETPALGFVVQSPSASQTEIDQAVTEFSKEFANTLAGLTDERLNQEKQAVISELLEQDRQLGEVSSRYWREIDRGAESFNSREQLAEAVKNVRLQELLDSFRKAALKREQSLRVVTGGNGLQADQALGRLAELPPVPTS